MILDYKIKGYAKDGNGLLYASHDFGQVSKTLAWNWNYSEDDKINAACWLMVPEFCVGEQISFVDGIPEIGVHEIEIVNATSITEKRGFVARVDVHEIWKRHRALVWSLVDKSVTELHDNHEIYAVQKKLADKIDAEILKYETGNGTA